MTPVRRASILTAIMLQMLMFGAIASPLADSVNSIGDASKMNQDLVAEISASNEDEILPVIYQLNSQVTDSDRAYF